MPKPKKNSVPQNQAPALNRKERDRAILLSAAVILAILFLLGLLAPALISMQSTLGSVSGFLLLAACLAGIALVADRLVLHFFK